MGAGRAAGPMETPPLKVVPMASKAWSATPLQDGKQALDNQDIKLEDSQEADEIAALEQQLQDSNMSNVITIHSFQCRLSLTIIKLILMHAFRRT